jgi:hypothetical protein
MLGNPSGYAVRSRVTLKANDSQRKRFFDLTKEEEQTNKADSVAEDIRSTDSSEYRTCSQEEGENTNVPRHNFGSVTTSDRTVDAQENRYGVAGDSRHRPYAGQVPSDPIELDRYIRRLFMEMGNAVVKRGINGTPDLTFDRILIAGLQVMFPNPDKGFFRQWFGDDIGVEG